jgi:hypothetical protein
MVKLVVAYKHPTDVEEFERRYKDEHVAMARRIPHMSRIEFGKVAANDAAMGQGAASQEGQAAIKHAADIASGGLDAMVVVVEE